ncbi:MAG: ATP-binding protein [Campylobacteraceae bacterium]
MKKLSLKLRLVIVVIISFVVASLIATSVGIYQTRDSLNEMFDTQIYYFAKRVALSNENTFSLSHDSGFLKKEPKMIDKHMSVDDDALNFSIFSLDGNRLFSDGEESKYLVFNKNVLNEKDGVLFEKNKKLKIVWMLSANKNFIVGVGQEREYVDEIVLHILGTQVIPWLFIIPILIFFVFLLISKELRPLNRLASDLAKRDPNDSTPLSEDTTLELKPFVKSLNSLFLKIKNMIEKERRFTSNAAHELKTPLAALKIQTEVAKLSLDDKPSLLKSLNNIETGVDRATRMIEQLLALSRLESVNEFENITDINWVEVTRSTIKELEFKAHEKNINVEFLHVNDVKSIKGEPFVLSLLLRNLLDNAIKYNKNGTNIKINLQKSSLCIEDDGKGVNPELLKNIGERFVRPAGQKQSGSGLGFSIVMHIAKLHGLRLNFENIETGGFRVTISW